MVDYDIINRIKAALSRSGMTQRQLAERLGKDETVVSRWLAGKVGVRASSLKQIASILDIDLANERIHSRKTALITGVTGQDGSFLSEFLLEKGYDVHGIIRRSSVDFRERIAHLEGRPHFHLHYADMGDSMSLIQVMAKVRPDEIYNLACPASPVHYQHDPIQTTKTSFLGAYHMLGLAKRIRCKILQASTSEVYGDPAVHPQPESYWGNVNPTGIRSCYDEGKRCAETMFFDYHRQHGVRIKVVRIFNTYGPRMALHDGRVVSNFIVQALRGEDITLYGDGRQTRSFQYVDDLVEGMIRMMASPDAFTGPVNLGNPGEFSMLSLAEKVIAETGSRSRIVFRPLPADDPRMRRPDISLARKELGWEPKISLDDGLRKTVDYFKGALGVQA